jgi:hypothetical protein
MKAFNIHSGLGPSARPRKAGMAEKLRIARLYWVLLAIVTAGRWAQGFVGTPYDRGHHVFSIVILTAFSTIYYGAFTRRWHGYRLTQAFTLTFMMGVVSQLVILLSTVASYGLGLETYFNNPRALQSTVPLAFGPAMVVRLGGLVGNSIFAGIGGALGWALGALLPER